MSGYIVISGHIVGNQERGFVTVWESDLEEKHTVSAAISHGFRTVGSDDFRIGLVKFGALRQLQFMEEAPRYFDELEYTAEQLGLRCIRSSIDDGPPLKGARKRSRAISGRHGESEKQGEAHERKT